MFYLIDEFKEIAPKLYKQLPTNMECEKPEEGKEEEVKAGKPGAKVEGPQQRGSKLGKIMGNNSRDLS